MVAVQLNQLIVVCLVWCVMARGRQKKPVAEVYKPYLCWFMAFKDGLNQPYHNGVVFTQQQLLSITPDDLEKYMNLLAYGTSIPLSTDWPTLCCATSLEFLKKAISHFSPHKYASWNVESGFGNPTKLVVVNNIIKKTHFAEVSKQGALSKVESDMK